MKDPHDGKTLEADELEQRALNALANDDDTQALVCALLAISQRLETLWIAMPIS